MTRNIIFFAGELTGAGISNGNGISIAQPFLYICLEEGLTRKAKDGCAEYRAAARAG
jgi:hypothetical protein